MALGDLFAQAKKKASKLYNQFFFDEDAPAPDMPRREAYPPQAQQPEGYYQQPQVQQAYPQPQQAEAYYQQPQAYSQPQPQAYAQPQQQAYQPQPQQAQPQFSAQYQPPQRNRRAQQHMNQPQDNVVPISAYQQAHQAQPQMPQAYQQPQPAPQAQQPYQQSQPVPPQQMPPQNAQASGAARIINARGIGDCRGAITLLRAGDAVVIVMDNITDPAEMRRYVDTLSGACFSLNATITKVSRYGAYFLAPQGMAVYADQVTSQMNGAQARPQAQRPSYPQPQAAYPPQPARQPVNPYPPQRANDPNGDFAPRVAEAAPQQPFYPREIQQAPRTPFSQQPEGYGYAPDEYREAAES